MTSLSPHDQNTEVLKDDFFAESDLRPTAFDEYIGQETAKRNVQVMIDAAKKRNEALDHVLLYGQAGLGKTTLATLIAKELGAHLKVTSGPVLEKTGDLAAILSTLEQGDMLFIDEAHRINRTIEEMLYPALESRQLHLVIGKGPAARMLTLDLPAFTLIAATTRVNLLSAPLRSRFGATFKLDYYSQKDIEEIIKRSARILGVAVAPDAVSIVAQASRFTPRTANRLLKRVRDLCNVRDQETITKDLAKEALAMFEIDELGLEEHDRNLLRIIIEKFRGGPVGLSTIAASMEEDKGAIEDVYEPFLIKVGLLQRTSQGRRVTPKAREHLGYED